MIEFYKQTKKNVGLKKLKDYSINSWVKVINPNEEEIGYLIGKFKLDRENIEDGLDSHEMPRVETEKNITYIYLRIPRTEGEVPTSSFLLVLTKDNLITISNQELRIFKKILESKNFLTNQKIKCLLQILSYISRRFNVNVRKILKEVKKDKRNISKLKNKDILDLVLQEDILNDYLFSFSPLIDMHSRILKVKTLKFSEEGEEFIEDLIIDLNQTLSTCKSALKTITNMRDYYSTTLSHNLNKVLTVLTVFTIFLTIPSIVGAIYGMNVKLPFQTHPHVFSILLGIILFTWGIAWIALKRKNIFN